MPRWHKPVRQARQRSGSSNQRSCSKVSLTQASGDAGSVASSRMRRASSRYPWSAELRRPVVREVGDDEPAGVRVVREIGQAQRRLDVAGTVAPEPGERVEAIGRQEAPATRCHEVDGLDDVLEDGLGDEVVERDARPAGLDALAPRLTTCLYSCERSRPMPSSRWP